MQGLGKGITDPDSNMDDYMSLHWSISWSKGPPWDAYHGS